MFRPHWLLLPKLAYRQFWLISSHCWAWLPSHLLYENHSQRQRHHGGPHVARTSWSVMLHGSFSRVCCDQYFTQVFMILTPVARHLGALLLWWTSEGFHDLQVLQRHILQIASPGFLNWQLYHAHHSLPWQAFATGWSKYNPFRLQLPVTFNFISRISSSCW